jgi:hypothetical protein
MARLQSNHDRINTGPHGTVFLKAKLGVVFGPPSLYGVLEPIPTQALSSKIESRNAKRPA